jgi:hypothetical protein
LNLLALLLVALDQHRLGCWLWLDVILGIELSQMKLILGTPCLGIHHGRISLMLMHPGIAGRKDKEWD